MQSTGSTEAQKKMKIAKERLDQDKDANRKLLLKMQQRRPETSQQQQLQQEFLKDYKTTGKSKAVHAGVEAAFIQPNAESWQQWKLENRCSGWTPTSGKFKGEGGHCKKTTDYPNKWCWVHRTYKGCARLFLKHSAVYKGKMYIPCGCEEKSMSKAIMKKELQAKKKKEMNDKKTTVEASKKKELQTKKKQEINDKKAKVEAK